MLFKRKEAVHEANKDINSAVIVETFLPVTLELAEVSQGIYNSSKSFVECSKTLGEYSGEITGSIKQNKQNVEEVHHEMTSIVRAAEDINERAVENEKLSKDNLEYAHLSMNDLNKSIQRIEGLFNYFSEAAVMLGQLQDYSKGIADITTYIDEISAKTSLLSINASIEAARAGEAGRGFMVITEEIKNLANQSKSFSENISKMLQNMIGCINRLNEVSEENSQNINGTKQMIDAMNNSLNKMIEGTHQLDENIQGTLTSSKTIKHSVEVGNQKVSELDESFKKTEACLGGMLQAGKMQDRTVKQLAEINEKTKVISEKQLEIVLSSSLKEKLTILGEKIAGYSGNHNAEELKKLAQKYYAKDIYYVDAAGVFVEGTEKEALGLNIFELNNDYKRFADSDKSVEVFPIARNLYTGEMIKFITAKELKGKHILSIGFDLKSIVKINEMSLKEIDAL